MGVKSLVAAQWMSGWLSACETGRYEGGGGISGHWSYCNPWQSHQSPLQRWNSDSTCAALSKSTSRCWNVATWQCSATHSPSLDCIFADSRDIQVTDWPPSPLTLQTVGIQVIDWPPSLPTLQTVGIQVTDWPPSLPTLQTVGIQVTDWPPNLLTYRPQGYKSLTSHQVS